VTSSTGVGQGSTRRQLGSGYQGAMLTARVGQVNAKRCDSQQTLEARLIRVPARNAQTVDAEQLATPDPMAVARRGHAPQ
jgi:hypothetical protein